MRPLLVRGGAVWQLVGLITRRSQVQILPPLPPDAITAGVYSGAALTPTRPHGAASLGTGRQRTEACRDHYQLSEVVHWISPWFDFLLNDWRAYSCALQQMGITSFQRK